MESEIWSRLPNEKKLDLVRKSCAKKFYKFIFFSKYDYTFSLAIRYCCLSESNGDGGGSSGNSSSGSDGGSNGDGGGTKTSLRY